MVYRPGSSRDGDTGVLLNYSHSPFKENPTMPLLQRFDTSRLDSGVSGIPTLATTANDGARIPRNLPFQDESIESCDFPITDGASGKRNVKSIAINCSWEGAQASHGDDTKKWLSCMAIAWSWAELLRLYTGADEVAFAWTDKAIDHDSTGHQRDLNERLGLCVCDMRTGLEGDIGSKMTWKETTPQVLGFDKIKTLLDFTRQFWRSADLLNMPLIVSCDVAKNDLCLYFDANRVNEVFAGGIAATMQDILMSMHACPDAAGHRYTGISKLDKSWIQKRNSKPLTEVRKSVVSMFKQQAATTPDSEAICSWDAQYSFAELDPLTDNLAHYMVSLGLKLGTFVPVMLPKSALFPLAVLAISKAGGAFVPLDPGTPVGRIASIVEDTQAESFICTELDAPVVKSLVKNALVLTHEVLNSIPAAYDEALPEVNIRQPFSCLFTSGSTGQPKGVVLSHQSVATDITEFARATGFYASRQIQCCPVAFDIAMMQTWLPLVQGGCICIPREDEYKTDLAGAINRMSVDTIMTVPSYAGVLDPKSMPTVKNVLVGGEMAKADVVARWTETARFSILYGPSETSPISNVHLCNDTEFRLGYVGSMLPCHRAIIVAPDDHTRLVPVGAVGHLLLGGICLADRYLNQPEKTRAAFIEPPPWARELGLEESRFYCSGDLVRYDTSAMDGSLVVVGRKDTQVKLRGQRIELGEIECHLQQLPGVESVMATVAKRGYYANHLVAILGLEKVKFGNSTVRTVESPHLTLSLMQESLRLHLPSYMIPTVLLTVKDMIFGGTLKLDRKRMTSWLEDTDFDQPKIAVQGHQLLSSSETTSATIADKIVQLCNNRAGNSCRSMLSGRDFTLDEAGLDSVQLIAMSIFIRSRFGVALPKSLVFGSGTTVRSIARFIDGSVMASCGSHQASVSGNVLDIRKEVDELSHQLDVEDDASVPIEQPAGVQERTETTRVFLTGATGLLGSEILRLLMSEPGISTIALVRHQDAASARQRLIDTAIDAEWWCEDYHSRIEVWQGDLSLPDLGLAPQHMLQLKGQCAPTDRISVIIHNGAVVHYGHDYAKMKATNVLSTLALLQKQRSNNSRGYQQALLYVSGGHQLSFGEEKDDVNIAGVMATDTGYAQSKLVSELLVKSRMLDDRSGYRPDISIVKPGYIVGTADGRIKPVRTDFIWRYLAACVSMQAVSEEHLDNWVFLGEVPKIASAVVSTALGGEGNDQRDGVSKITKVLGGMRLRSLIDLLTEEFRFVLRPMPRAKWLDLLRHAVENEGEAHPLFPLMDHFVADFQIFQPEADEAQAMSVADPSVFDVVRANVQALIEMGVLM